jgi:protein xylosyltransferase
MWKIGKRQLPTDIHLEGGSDWFCLSFKFINYINKSKDSYIQRLKLLFQYTLLPSESFFHSVIINSPFCLNFINSNLKLINWNRNNKIQRKCSMKTVDWCDSSPNIFYIKDWPRIKVFIIILFSC